MVHFLLPFGSFSIYSVDSWLVQHNSAFYSLLGVSNFIDCRKICEAHISSLSTPFWEFQTITSPWLYVRWRSRKLTFYSLLGVSVALFDRDRTASISTDFLLPFGSFGNGGGGGGGGGSIVAFLLPFGSFNCKWIYCSCKLWVSFILSTPFWEFQKLSVEEAYAVFDALSAFYSLLGVSPRIFFILSSLFVVIPFYSLLGVSISFTIYSAILWYIWRAFYSLLGVSMQCMLKSSGSSLHITSFLLPFGSFCVFIVDAYYGSIEYYVLSTPFWEFPLLADANINPYKWYSLSTPFWEFLSLYMALV